MKKSKEQDVTVQIDTETVRRILEERIADRIEALFEHTYESTVSATVEKLVEKLAGAEIKKAVQDALTEGWQATNTYGEPLAGAPKLGLKGRIADMLTKLEGDYNNRITRVDKLAKEVIDAALRDQFGKEIQAARERFKKQLDDVVAAKFTETIKSALGLR